MSLRQPHEISAAEDVLAAMELLWGETAPARGVLHVAAAWQAPDARLVVMKICDRTPKSAWDFFVLNLARAQADAIITTGRILREEPELRHDLQGPAAEALADYRKTLLGKTEPPMTLVLTSGRELDLDHPLFAGSTRPLIYTSAGDRLASEARRRALPLVIDPQADLRRAVSHLRVQTKAATVSIEAGPSTTRSLYAPPLAVDVLALSLFESERLEASLQGGDLPSRRALETLFSHRSSGLIEETRDGTWRFCRYSA
jgi:riboflavin biosynthesis pyrimidine reductase